MKIEIADNEVVLINNIEEYEIAYPNLRSASSMPFSEWLETFGSPIFPIYLEGIYSVTKGYSIGYTAIEPECKMILTLEDFK